MIGISRLGMQLRNLVGHDFSFFHVAISCKHADRFPLVFLGEHLLLNLVAVLAIRLFAAFTMVCVER